MSSSSFPYNWENVIHVIKNIHYITNYKDSKCDIYTKDYISKSPIHCSKGNLKCVLKCANFTEKKSVDICSRQTVHKLNTDTNNLVLVLTKTGEEKPHITNF